MKFIEKVKAGFEKAKVKTQSLIKKLVDKYINKLDETPANVEEEVVEERVERVNEYVLPNVSEEKRAEAQKVVAKAEKVLEKRLEKDINEYSALQDDANKIHDEEIKEDVLAKANKLADKVTKESAKTNVPTETLIEKYLVEHAIKDLNKEIKEEAVLTKSQKRYVRKTKIQKEAKRLTHLNEIYNAQIDRIYNVVANNDLSEVTVAILEAKIKTIQARIDKNLKLLNSRTLLTETMLKKAERANLKKVKASHKPEMDELKDFQEKILGVEKDYLDSAKPKIAQGNEHDPMGLENAGY